MNLFDIIQNIGKVFIKYWPLFLKGLGVTLLLSAITVIGGAIFGTLIAFGRMSESKNIFKKILKRILGFYVEFIRGVPLLLQLFVIVLLLPTTWDKFISISIALVINSSAYVSEIVRAGIQAVDVGQTEAARSLGLTKTQTTIKIILPQAIKNILPAIGNEFIMVIKETSLASTFFIGDLMTAKGTITSLTYLSLEPYIIIAIIYFSLTYSLSKLIRWFERRLELV